MLKNTSFQGFLIAACFFLISLFIYKWFIEEKDEILIDNPTDKLIEVTLNQKKISIAPKTYEVVDLKDGQNQISAIQNHKVILKDTIFINTKPRAVINPTFSDYYIFTQFYGYHVNTDSLMRANQITIDSVIYYGDIKKNNQLIINDFYFNLNQDLPKVIKNKKRNENRSKIFRKQSFIDFYHQNFK